MLAWMPCILKSPPNPICPECGKNIRGRHIQNGATCYILVHFAPEIEHESDAPKSEPPRASVQKVICGTCFEQGKG